MSSGENHIEPEKFLIRLLLRRHNIPNYDYSGMQKLANIINSSQTGIVSVNTLARVAGLRSDHRKPYKHTLDFLARAAHYASYEQYYSFITQKSRIQLHNNTELLSPFIVDYTGKAAASSDTKFLKELISHIENQGVSISTLYHLSASFTVGLRENPQPRQVINLLSGSSIAFELFLENYVDRDFFNGYYGAAMVEMSKTQKEQDRHFLFSNAIALIYEKASKNTKSYRQRGKKMMEIDEGYLLDSLNKKLVYPVARWIGATADYLYENNEVKKGDRLIEKMLEYNESLTPDEQIIMLSECSESAVHIRKSLREELEKTYCSQKSKILLEFDSLANAGLNLMMADRKKNLISRQELNRYLIQYPFQFPMCKETISKKAELVFS